MQRSRRFGKLPERFLGAGDPVLVLPPGGGQILPLERQPVMPGTQALDQRTVLGDDRSQTCFVLLRAGALGLAFSSSVRS